MHYLHRERGKLAEENILNDFITVSLWAGMKALQLKANWDVRDVDPDEIIDTTAIITCRHNKDTFGFNSASNTRDILNNN